MDDLIYRESARRIIDSPRNKEQMLAILNSLPPEPSIPISWIEEQIKRIKSADNMFAELTAMNIEILLKRWRNESN